MAKLDPSKIQSIVRFSLEDEFITRVLQTTGFHSSQEDHKDSEYLPLKKQKVVVAYVFSTKF